MQCTYLGCRIWTLHPYNHSKLMLLNRSKVINSSIEIRQIPSYKVQYMGCDNNTFQRFPKAIYSYQAEFVILISK